MFICFVYFSVDEQNKTATYEGTKADEIPTQKWDPCHLVLLVGTPGSDGFFSRLIQQQM